MRGRSLQKVRKSGVAIFGEQVALTPLIRAPPAPTFSLKGRRDQGDKEKARSGFPGRALIFSAWAGAV